MSTTSSTTTDSAYTYTSSEGHPYGPYRKRLRHPLPTSTAEVHHSKPARTRTVLIVVLILVLMICAAALVLYLLCRPKEPQFSVMAAEVYELNITSSVSPPLVFASLQFTLLARNPNAMTVASYDQLAAYVTYKDQPLTRAVEIPPLTLGKQEAITLSPVMGGGVPVEAAEAVVNGLKMDEEYGQVGLRVVVVGRLRWKAVVFWSWHRSLSVRCDVQMGLKKGLVGSVPLQTTTPCQVDA